MQENKEQKLKVVSLVIKNALGRRVNVHYCKNNAANSGIAIIISPIESARTKHDEEVYRKFLAASIKSGFSVVRVFMPVAKDLKELDSFYKDHIVDLTSVIDFILDENNVQEVANSGDIWILAEGILTLPGMIATVRRPEVRGFVMVNGFYGTTNYNAGFFAPIPCNGLICHLHNDDQNYSESTSYKKTFEFYQSLKENKSMYEVKLESFDFEKFGEALFKYLNFSVAVKINKPVRKRRRKRRKTEKFFDDE